MSLSLYDLDADLRDLAAALLDAGGEIDDDLNDRFDALLDARDDKVRGYVAVIRNMEAAADATKAERTRLQNRERALSNSAARLKERLLESMLARGEDAHDTPLGKVRVQHASKRSVVLKVSGPDELPDQFCRHSLDVDKAALADALAEGDPEAAAVAELAPAAPFLRIY